MNIVGQLIYRTHLEIALAIQIFAYSFIAAAIIPVSSKYAFIINIQHLYSTYVI